MAEYNVRHDSDDERSRRSSDEESSSHQDSHRRDDHDEYKNHNRRSYEDDFARKRYDDDDRVDRRMRYRSSNHVNPNCKTIFGIFLAHMEKFEVVIVGSAQPGAFCQ